MKLLDLKEVKQKKNDEIAKVLDFGIQAKKLVQEQE